MVFLAFIAVLVVVLILAIKPPTVATLEANNTAKVAEAAETFDGSAQSFMPGQVSAGYQPVAGSTAISNKDGLHQLRNVGNNGVKTGNFHLTQNITMDRNFAPLWIQGGNNNSWNGYYGKDYWGDRFFDGVLDGCGYTITFPYDNYNAWGTTTKDDAWFAAGLIVGILRGTVKNLNVRIEGTTACFSDDAAGDGTGFGVIASKAASNALIDNCTVTIASGMYLRFHCTRNRASSAGGFVGIAEGNSKVKNSKLIVESGAKFELNNNTSNTTGTDYDSSIGGIIGEVRDTTGRTVVESCYLSSAGTIKGNVNNGSADVFVGGAVGVVEGGTATKVDGFYYDFTGRLESMEGPGGGEGYWTPNGHRVARNAYVSNLFYRNDYGTSDGLDYHKGNPKGTIWTNNDSLYVTGTPVQVRREAFYNNYNSVTTNVNTARIDSIYFNRASSSNLYVVTYYNAPFTGTTETVVGQIGNNENTTGETGRLFDPNKPGKLEGLCFMRNATGKWHFTDTTKSTFTSTGKMNIVYRQGQLGKVVDTGSASNKTFIFDGSEMGDNAVDYLKNNLQIQDNANNSLEGVDLNLNNHGVGAWADRNPEDASAKGYGASVQIKNSSNQIVYNSATGLSTNGGMIKPGTYTATLRPSGTQQYMCGFVVMALKNSYATNQTSSSNKFIAVSGDLNPLPTITFTVSKRDVQVEAPQNLQHTYGDVAVAMTPSYNSGLVSGYDLTVTLTCGAGFGQTSSVGTYPITVASTSDPQGVYNVVYTGHDYTVVARNLTLQADKIEALSKVYGEVDNLVSTIETGFNDDTLSIKYSRSPEGNNVGTYNIVSAVKNETNDNYGNITIAANAGNGKFTITQRVVGLDWGNADFTYTGGNQLPTATATNLVPDDTCGVTVTGAQVNYSPTPYTATATSLQNGNYKLPTDESIIKKSFTIKQYHVSLSPNVIQKTYSYSDADSLKVTEPTTVNGESIKVIYTRDTSSATPENVGFYNITNVQLDPAETSNNYTCSLAEGGGTNKFQIVAKEVGLNWGNCTFTYDGTDQVPEATATGLKEGDDCDVTVGGAKKDYSASQYTATATGLTNNNYKLPANVTQNFTIAKYTVVITPSLIQKEYGEPDASYLNATVPTTILSETINVTYSRHGDNTVGKYDIYAVTLNGSFNNYECTLLEGSGTQRFEIIPRTIGLVWGDTTFTYTGSKQKPSATANNLVGADTCYVTVTGEMTNAGSYTATASSLGNNNYKLPADNTKGFIIEKLNVAVSPKKIDRIYGDELNLTETVQTGILSESIVVKYTKNGENIVGTYDITHVELNQTYDNYTCSLVENSGLGMVQIVEREIVISWTNLSLPYNGKAQRPTATVSNLVIGDTCNITVKTNPENAIHYSSNQYIAEANTIDNSNYKLPAAKTQGFYITQFNIEVTPSYLTKEYGATDALNEVILTGVEDETVTVKYTRNGGEDVGLYSFESVQVLNNNNYTAEIKSGKGADMFEILPKNIKVSARIFSKTYGADNPAFEEEFSTGVSTETITAVYELGADGLLDNAGTYSFVSVSQKTENNNYTVEFALNGGKNKFTINKANKKVTAEQYQKTYGESDPEFSDTIKGAKNEDISITYVRNTGESYQKAGTYSFTGIETLDTNHNITFDTNGGLNKFTINTRAITITAETSSKIYGEPDPSFSQSFIGYYSKPYTVTYKRDTSLQDVGTYSFTEVLISDSSYTISFDPDGGKDKFTINQRNVSVVAKNFEKIYGQNDPTLTEVRAGYYDTPYTITYTRDTASPGINDAGSYDLLTLSTDNTNYNLIFDENGGKNKFKINPLNLSVVANNFSKPFGTDDPIFEQTVTGGYAEQIVVVFTRSLIGDVQKVGKYSFESVSLKVENNNYTTSFATNGGVEKFEITRKNISDADVTVTGIVSKTYTGVQITQTFELNWGETVITDYTVSYTTEYNVNVNTGGRIVLTGTGNYSGERVETFEITPRDISTLTFTDVQGGTYTGEAHTPVSAVSFGSINLIPGTDYTNSYLHNINAGEATLVITGQGNYNSSINKSFTIAKAALTYTWTNSSNYTYNRTGQGATVEISGLQGSHSASQGFSVVYTGNTYGGTAYNSTTLPTEAAAEYTATVTIVGGTEYTNNYEVPANVSNTFSINKADMLGVYFEGTTVVYDGSTRYLNVSNLNQPVIATSANNVIDIVPANATNNTGDQANIVYIKNGVTGISLEGTQIKATLTSVNYNDKVMVATLVIQRANSIIDIRYVVKDYVYNGNEQVVDSGATLNHNEATLVYSNNRFKNVPSSLSKEITISVPQTDHYNEASVTFSISIAKAKYNVSGITFTDAEFTYDGNKKSVTIAGSLPTGLTVEYINNEYTNVGTYTATARVIGDEVNYETVANKIARLVIKKAYYNTSSLTFEDKIVDYNGQVQTILLGGNLPEGLTVEYVNNENENAGTYVVAARFTGDFENHYEVEEMNATLTIKKVAYDFSQIKFLNQTKVYNKQSQSARIEGVLPVGFDGIPVTVNYAGNITNVGVREVVAMFNSNSMNYTLPFTELTANLTISPAPLTMVPKKVYTVSAPHIYRPIKLLLNEHYTIDGLFSGDNAEISHTAEYASTEIGETTIHVKLLATNNNNYTVGDGTVIVDLLCEIVDGVQIEITGSAFTFTGLGISPEIFVGVGTTEYTDNYTVKYFDALTSEELNDLPVNVGEYKVVVDYDDDLDRKTLEQNFTIEKAEVDISLDSTIPGIYGRFARHTAHAYGLITDDFKAQAQVSYSYEGRQPKAGTHFATVKFAGSRNYLPKTVQIEFTVKPQDVIVRVSGGGRPVTYDGKAHTLTFDYSSLATGDEGFVSVDFGDGASAKKDVGRYEGVLSNNNPNYNVVRYEGSTTLTINPKTLNVSVYTEDEGVENETINWTIEYSGFIDGENESSLTKKPVVVKNKYPSGLHQVVAEGGIAKNYEFRYLPYALRVYVGEITAKDNTTNVTVEGSFGPETYLEISDLAGEVDNTSDNAVFNASNVVLKAYKVEIKADDKNETYKVKFVDSSIKVNAFTRAYYLTESGVKLDIPNSQMANGEIVFMTNEAGRIVVYQNFTILYIIGGILLLFLVIFTISRLRRSASVSSAREKYIWLR